MKKIIILLFLTINSYAQIQSGKIEYKLVIGCDEKLYPQQRIYPLEGGHYSVLDVCTNSSFCGIHRSPQSQKIHVRPQCKGTRIC